MSNPREGGPRPEETRMPAVIAEAAGISMTIPVRGSAHYRAIIQQHGGVMSKGPALAFAEFARTFHCFGRRSPEALARIGVDPWDVDKFLAYARSGVASGGTGCVVRFLLSVWSNTDWTDASIGGAPHLTRFDLHDLNRLDAEHAAAVAAWVQDPWWP